jgi:hypothetical protein
MFLARDFLSVSRVLQHLHSTLMDCDICIRHCQQTMHSLPCRLC